VYAGPMPSTAFKRIIVRAVLRDVYPMVMRLIAVPDSFRLSDFDDVFQALLGWDAGTGFAFQIQGQEYNSFRRNTRARRLCDFRLHRREKFLYTLGALDQWEWDVRVIDTQDGADGDEVPVCLGGRGATPPQYSGGPTGYRLMLKRQQLGERMFEPAQVETALDLLTGDQPASTRELLRSVLADGARSLDQRLEASGPLEPQRFSLREANERLTQWRHHRRPL
jgi:Plasmid pRiA4b ORF-3-like protein